MEKYYRKILLKNVIQVIDTDGDGTGDSLVFLPKEPINLQFTLIQSIDDMGLYNEYVETEEEIDLGGIWNTGNNGTGDGGVGGSTTGTINLPGISTTTVVTTGPVTIGGCMDSTATNYNPSATRNDGGCVYGTDIVGCTDPSDVNYNPYATTDDGSCFGVGTPGTYGTGYY